MYHLIKKDLLVQKRNLKLTLLIMLFFLFTFQTFGPAGFTLSVVSITYMLMQGAFAIDDKNNSDRMLISLPIKKNLIVLSKYVSIFVFSLYAIFFNMIIYFVLKMLNTPFQGFMISVENVYAALCGIMFYSSITFPLLFKLGYHQAKMANFFIFFACIFGGTYLVNEFMVNPSIFTNQIMQFFSSRSEMEIVSITFIPIIVIFIISYYVSLHIYKNREY